jgi:ketosteroid isomerase-like protein
LKQLLIKSFCRGSRGTVFSKRVPLAAGGIGKKALTQAMESYREELKNITITQYVIDFKEVKIIGDHAYEWGEFHHKYFTKDNPGKELEQKGRLMRILRRLPDGQWKVARAIWTE